MSLVWTVMSHFFLCGAWSVLKVATDIEREKPAFFPLRSLQAAFHRHQKSQRYLDE